MKVTSGKIVEQYEKNYKFGRGWHKKMKKK